MHFLKKHGVRQERKLIQKDSTSMESVTIENRKYSASPLVTVSEAAKFLGVGKKTVYRLIEEDRLRASRVARSVLVEQDSLEAFKRRGELT
jgi:excisionase family DNA binding protein